MYKANDVAKYCIQYTNNHGGSISNSKLQKVLYFLQAEHLIDHGTPLFKEEIEALFLGPVVRVVYDRYLAFGSNPISEPLTCFQGKDYRGSTLDDVTKQEIAELLDSFQNYDSETLLEVIREQQPWINAFKKPLGYRIISIHDLILFFREGDEK